MADNGASGFWSLDFWSNITNLIGVVILGMAVPIGKWLVDRRARILTENRKKEDERIASICKQFVDPMMTKLNDISGKVNFMEEIVKKNITFGEDDDDNRGGSARDIDGRGGPPGDGRGRNSRPSNLRDRERRRYDPYAGSNNNNSHRGGSSSAVDDYDNSDMR